MIKPSMKKATALATSVLEFLTFTIPALAVSPTPPPPVVNIVPPGGFIDPNVPGGISTIVNNALIILFSAAAVLVLVFLIIGAFQWITSGGDKEAVGKARSRITAALIGLAILVLAFVILQVIGGIIGVNFLNFEFPRLDQPVPTPIPAPK